MVQPRPSDEKKTESSQDGSVENSKVAANDTSEGEEEKKTDTSNTESNQKWLAESSEVGANGTSVSSLCNASISHLQDTECEQESSSLSLFVAVTEKEEEVVESFDTVDSESNPSIIDIEHDSLTDHHQEEAANGKKDPTVENVAIESSSSDITTTSPSPTTESKPPKKEDSDTEMIDAK
ncbi:Ubiquitin carboxyl-terminal hydrolase 19 [Cardamine amara subsp. amara]|uniref:Ubiquitin carboxyl-terminal hydrolase 19 n=1 Tax=Cardamine amara subsp. amara TaxID=228776 RepID=A0ABD1C9B6_CARAN